MQLPPGPRAPALVQIAQWIARPLQLLAQCQRRFGDVFTLRAPKEGNFVVVANPELIKAVLTADPDTLLAGQGNATMLEPMLGKHSLLTLDGAEHLRQRRLLLPAFHGERMRAYATAMREITHASIDRWPLGSPFSLHDKMQAITLDVILQTVFGVTEGDHHGALRARLVELLDVVTKPWLLFPGILGLDPFKVPWLKITKLKRTVDDTLYAMITERRRRATGGDDVLSMMLEARDEQGAPMTDVELRDELVTLLLAGHETTATSLAWAFDQLLASPEALARLRTELAAGRDEYLDAVIRETLRVRPIVPLVGRVAARPFQLGPWMLPVGTRVAPSIYLAGQRADAYPAPQRFDPSRWLGVKPDPYTWLPFGGGIRRCIGMAFAQFEMKIVLETVVTRTRLEAVGGPARVVRRGITLAPAGGTRVVLAQRPQRTATAA
ncbi:MAG: cytochrome P450 [Myxococcales bacterium]|nr:cytochrome P450 [Myxococcales bacterium]